MKNDIKTLENLEDKLDKESAWRGKEIEEIKLKVKNNTTIKGHPLTIGDKALVLILYADWEGFVNVAANLYVRYVFSQNIPLYKLKTGFWEVQLHPSFNNIKVRNSQESKKQFLDKLRSQFKTTQYRPYHSNSKKRYISTNSNLNSKTFTGILDILGLDNVSSFHLSNNFIDSILLNYRNELAHGERGYDVDFSNMVGVINHITKLMGKFKKSIIQAAQKKSYLNI